MPAHSAIEIAEWMRSEFNREGLLDQAETAQSIEERFGPGWVFENNNGGTSISRAVLHEFRKLTATYVVWERGALCWRRREKTDSPGSRLAS